MAAVPATMLLSSLTLSRPSSVPLLKSPIARRPSYGGCSVSIECSSRPQKKCTAHHVKTRPKKHNPYDKNRKGPTKYPRPPKPPPIWGWDLSGEPQQEIAAVKSEESAPVSAPDL